MVSRESWWPDRAGSPAPDRILPAGSSACARDVPRHHQRDAEVAERPAEREHRPGQNRAPRQRHGNRPEDAPLRTAERPRSLLQPAVDRLEPRLHGLDEQRNRAHRRREHGRAPRERQLDVPAPAAPDRAPARRSAPGGSSRGPSAAAPGAAARRRRDRGRRCARASAQASGTPAATVKTFGRQGRPGGRARGGRIHGLRNPRVGGNP